MTIHEACRDIYGKLLEVVFKRADIDRVIEGHVAGLMKVGLEREWDLIRNSVSPAISELNLIVQGWMRDLIECECPIYKEEELEREKLLPRKV